MTQWFHYYEMHDHILDLVVRTFASVFPFVEIWDTQAGDLVMLGSLRPWESSIANFRKVFERELPRRDLEEIGLPTPELVFIRQLASQNTAFALASPGPVQLDNFPVLEYAAPKAFYIGATASQFLAFDERTVQSVFAPEEKRTALQSVPEELLKDVFARYPSGNRRLSQYLQWRARQVRKNGEHGIYSDAPYLPIILRPENSYPAQPESREGGSAELASLLEIEASFFNSPENWRSGVQTILDLLEERDENGSSPGWSVSYFASLGSRICFKHGDLELAREVVRSGLAKAPGDKGLEYLERVLERF
jgi:hypothetical protein